MLSTADTPIDEVSALSNMEECHTNTYLADIELVALLSDITITIIDTTLT